MRCRIKMLFLLFLMSAIVPCLRAQENPVSEQQFEQYTAGREAENEDDASLQVLQYYLQHKLNLNAATPEELQWFPFLTPLHFSRFFQYKFIMGPLASIYELQAIPGWDIEIIRQLLPYVYVAEVVSVKMELWKRFKSGEQSLLFRSGTVLEPSVGFLRASDSGSSAHYSGSRVKMLFRYKYQYGNKLQYGITAEKDPGEQWFKGAQRNGFDFYSFHIFLRQLKSIHTLAIGDYTVNMGQGLLQWQSLAFGKSVDVLQIKRQSEVIRPYNSSGEHLFNRGIAVTVRKQRIELSCFFSDRKLDGNLNYDSLLQEQVITSFIPTGYHRTLNEQQDRSQVRLISSGAVCRYRQPRFSFSVNALYSQFNKVYHKSSEPYNFYSFRGRSFLNAGFDWSYTFRNLHWFGEWATHKGRYHGVVSGLLISVASAIDFSAVYRNLQPGYQTLYGNAFTESTQPSNEQGLFMGLVFRLHPALKLEAYTDMFRFPWLRYGVHAPSAGSDYVFQLTHKLSKKTEMHVRCKRESKFQNLTNEEFPIPVTEAILRKSVRFHFQHAINRSVVVRHRVEVLQHQFTTKQVQNGYLTFFDLFYKSAKSVFSANGRILYFDTDSYNSGIYAYENDLLYSFSVPVFYNKGYKYYFNFSYHLGKKALLHLRWSRLHMLNQTTVGSGLDLIQKPVRSEFRGQLFVRFG